MTGEYSHTIDAKGRLFMPAKLREELGEAFFICKGLGGCLFVYSSQNWADFESKVSAMPITKAIPFQRNIFPTAGKCEPDAQGRILIPQKLREYAKLDKAVTVVGLGNHAEIWNTSAWEELTKQQNEETLAAHMDELGF
ncbi:MAG: division/cell wall cluster transcriptional repressor MraZ [Oscillospiraceae bacterium]|jgi:MraZ protein|nr:division/cell wall cluster transcriptional repressor MraZ [Oscillospiraceae bacterium]